MPDNKTKDRILYADILRIVTIFSVIVFHITTTRWFAAFTPDTMNEWQVLNFFVCFLRWCVPVFFMLSGMIYLDPDYKISFKKLYTKTIPRMLCALIFWGVTYRLLSPLTATLLDVKEVTSTDWQKIYTEIFTGIPWHHLWFIYPLVGMYILVPILRVFTIHAKREHLLYFVVLYFIFGSLIPYLNGFYRLHISFTINALNSYVGYFISGYFFHKYNLKTGEKIVLYTLGAVSLLGTFIIPTMIALKSNGPVTHYFDRLAPHIMLSAFFVFVLIKNIVNKSLQIQRYKNNRYITLLANCGLGIYMVHDFFNILLGMLHLDTSTFPAIVSVPVYAIFIYMASFGVVLIIKKIPVLNKWII